MILSKVPSNDGEACPVAAGGCTVHTGRTLHYTGAVVSLSFCQLLLCRTRDTMQIYRTSGRLRDLRACLTSSFTPFGR